MKDRYELVERAITFVVGVSVGLLLATMQGNMWVISAFVLGIGLILGFYARRPATK
jgi:F0F1-type ATP synthase assembly protein I